MVWGLGDHFSGEGQDETAAQWCKQTPNHDFLADDQTSLHCSLSFSEGTCQRISISFDG